MADPKVGEMLLHDFIVPALFDGRYRLDVSTSVLVDGQPQPLGNRLAFFDVEGPRFTLAPAEIGGVFPPKNGHGPFDEAIPHVALGRRTLPWERPFSAARASVDGTPVNAGGTPIPWMALLVFEDGECTIELKQKIGDRLPPDIVTRLSVPADTLVDTVTAKRELIVDMMPAYEELALLTHVRQVNVDDRELSAGDSDGFFAVIMANRVPQRGRRYRCCLVSIEERTDIVPEKPPAPDEGFHIVDTLAISGDLVVGSAARYADLPGSRPFGGGEAIARTAAAAQAPGVGVVTRSASALSGLVVRPVKGVLTDRGVLLQSQSLILLAAWTFECEGTASFRALMQGLDVGMIGTPHDGGPQITDTGHIRVDSLNRAGAPETDFYRGPLVPTPLTRDPNGPYHSADQARRAAPDVGAEDVSYACAFEVGRLLAAADARLAQELMRWRRTAYTRSAKADAFKRLRDFAHIVELIDDRLPLAAFFATRAVTRMANGCGPIADPSRLTMLTAAPGLNADLVRQMFALETIDQAHALLGAGHTLLGNVVDPAAGATLPADTLESVLRDTAGLKRLHDMRARMLDNVKTQLKDFGRIVS